MSPKVCNFWGHFIIRWSYCIVLYCIVLYCIARMLFYFKFSVDCSFKFEYLWRYFKTFPAISFTKCF